MPNVTEHPSAEQLKAFGLGELSPAEQARVERHVAVCPLCCAALGAVPDDTLLDRLRAAQSPSTWFAGSVTNAVPVTPPLPLPAELRNHPKYHVVKLLGSGGMGMVFQAEHRLMERLVALKLIHRGLTDQPEVVERFRQEVRAAARLAHPNIVTAYDAEQAGDVHYLVMEFVDGTSLARHVERHGRLPVAQACDCIVQAALGLQHAVDKGMVHRDIKPQNLMLTPHGQVKILDFGLAMLARRGKRITQIGTVMGTPDYIAPEQAQDSRRADVRSDIYSLGCTLYFLLSGTPPFPKGSVETKLLSQIEQTAPPLNEFRSDLPPGLIAVLDRMMAKDPARRYQTPVAVVEALAPFACDPNTHSSAVRSGPRPTFSLHAKVAVLAGAAAIGLSGLAMAAGLLLMFVLNREPAAGPTTKDGAPLAAKPSASRPRVVMLLASKDFHYPDYKPVRDVLERDDRTDVKIASSVAGRAIPEPWPQDAISVPIDHRVDDIDANDFDALIVCGGEGNLEFLNGPSGPAVTKLINEMLDKGKYVTALCKGSLVLATSGVLKNRRATGWPKTAPDYFAKFGAIYVDQPVIISGDSNRIITGRDPASAEQFAETLRSVLLK